MTSYTVELHQLDREQTMGLIRGQGLDMEVIASDREIRQTVSEYLGCATGDWDNPIVWVVV